MSDFSEEAVKAFQVCANNDEIVGARFSVLDNASKKFADLADILQTSGWIQRDDKELAVALLTRLGSELSGGISLLARRSLIYSAGALLRQLIEVEYLMFIGYADPMNLQRWYRADPKELRKDFTPQRMRKRSDGLFRDQEYWFHCEVGGHPHPKSRMLLPAYNPLVPPVAVLLPDAVQHVRRLWTSVKPFLPKLSVGDIALKDSGQELSDSIDEWQRLEHPLILSFDGIARQ